MRLIVTFKLDFVIEIPGNFYLKLVEGGIMNTEMVNSNARYHIWGERH
jgi:hypothetical protein